MSSATTGRCSIERRPGSRVGSTRSRPSATGRLKPSRSRERSGAEKVVVYLDVIEFHGSPPRDGERVVLVRGDGPRDGDVMSWATVRHHHHDLVLGAGTSPSPSSSPERLRSRIGVAREDAASHPGNTNAVKSGVHSPPTPNRMTARAVRGCAPWAGHARRFRHGRPRSARRVPRPALRRCALPDRRRPDAVDALRRRRVARDRHPARLGWGAGSRCCSWERLPPLSPMRSARLPRR
jgi:hypothetical protein